MQRLQAALEEQVADLQATQGRLRVQIAEAGGIPRKRLGNSDLYLPVISLGCFSFGGDRKMGSHLSEQFSKLHEGVWGDQPDEETFAAVKSALDCGINFFDNAGR